MKIPIVEIYSAIQAEGKHRTPAVFVRIFGCNLRCSFNIDEEGKGRCDTSYAVYKDQNKAQLMDTKEIFKKIMEYKIPHIVLTGGEPTLYQEALEEVIGLLPGNYLVEIETNGTNVISDWLQRNVEQFNISVKLKNSNQWRGFDKKRINKEAIMSFPTEKSVFKFVVVSENDIDEIKEISKLRPDIPVTLMVQGETREQILKNIKPTLDLCMKYGYGFTNRDHILAYSDERKR